MNDNVIIIPIDENTEMVAERVTQIGKDDQLCVYLRNAKTKVFIQDIFSAQKDKKDTIDAYIWHDECEENFTDYFEIKRYRDPDEEEW